MTQQSSIDHVSRDFQRLKCQELGVCFKEEQLVRKAAPMTLALCGGEEAYGCRTTNGASTPIALADNQFFRQRDSNPTASTAGFESQSSRLKKEDDTPMVKVPVRLGVDGPGEMRPTCLRLDIQVLSRTHLSLVFCFSLRTVRGDRLV